MRICSKCDLSLDESKFYIRKNGNLHRECKECYKKRIRDYRKNNLEYVRNKEKEYRKLDPEKYKKRDRKRQPKRKLKTREYSLRRLYNITLNEYYQILSKQNNGCAICGAEKSKSKNFLCVDHDHQSGNIRGILCDNCNRGLGLFKDNPELLLNAFNYLNFYNSNKLKINTKESSPIL